MSNDKAAEGRSFTITFNYDFWDCNCFEDGKLQGSDAYRSYDAAADAGEDWVAGFDWMTTNWSRFVRAKGPAKGGC